MELTKFKDNPDLLRDETTSAVVATADAYTKYKTKRKVIDRIDSLENSINTLETKLDNILAALSEK